MLPHQQRVLIERDDLETKVEALRQFLKTPAYQSLDMYERARMERQYCYMRSYLGVLGERIANFPE